MPAADDDEAPINSVIMKSADEVADALNVHAATVRRLAAAGQLPALKVGSQWRFNIDAVKAAMEAKAMQSTTIREHNKRIRARARERAERTIVFEIEGQPGSCVVVVHPGHTLEADAQASGFQDVNQYLLFNFGLIDPTRLMKMSDSWAAIPDDPGIDAEIAAAEADLVELRERKALHARIESGIVDGAQERVDALEAERAAETSKGRTKASAST